MAGESPLSFGATVSLSATSSTGRATLPALNSNQLVITNLGPDLAYVTLGGATVVATSTTGYPMMPGTQIAVTINPTIVAGAAICATTTATVLFTAADGALHGLAAASTGASGGVTDNVNVAQWGGVATTLGQKTMAASVPVVISSDQSDLSIEDTGFPVDGSGTITTGTGTVVSTGIDGFSTVTFSIQGTYAGLYAVFEQSDDAGVTWYPVDAYRIGTGLIEPGVNNLTNASVNWRASINGSDSFRLRATALSSGTVNVLMSFSAMPSAAGVGVTANFADNRPTAGTITARDVGSTTSGALQNGAVLITGSPTANSTFALALNGYSGFYALVTGTWTGTMQFEKSIDSGTTWTPFSVHIDGTAYTQVAITANCMVRSAGAGATNIRLRSTAVQTGTVNVQFVFASADTVVTLTNSARLFDNTSGATMTIKPASTVPAATDTAVVVALSPNGSLGSISTLSTTITRPSDTNAYAANDAFANSTSAPTAGGFTLTGAARASSGYGTITDAVFSMSASSAFQGELWIFDQAVTATNDNAALSVSDGDILNLVGVIPFNTTDVDAVNAISYVTGLNIGFTCVGTANLRFLVKVISAFTPASAEVLSVRVKVQN